MIQVMEGVSLGQHPTPPEGCPDVIKSLMLSCWEHFPQNRNKFSKIVEILCEYNIKASMGHSNKSYGMSLEQRKSSTPSLLECNQNKKCDAPLNTPEQPTDKITSWPKLSNFSNLSRDDSKGFLCEKSEVLKISTSTDPVTEYTVILPDGKDKICIES
jgi:hypothetical protein